MVLRFSMIYEHQSHSKQINNVVCIVYQHFILILSTEKKGLNESQNVWRDGFEIVNSFTGRTWGSLRRLNVFINQRMGWRYRSEKEEKPIFLGCSQKYTSLRFVHVHVEKDDVTPWPVHWVRIGSPGLSFRRFSLFLMWVKFFSLCIPLGWERLTKDLSKRPRRHCCMVSTPREFVVFK